MSTLAANSPVLIPCPVPLVLTCCIRPAYQSGFPNRQCVQLLGACWKSTGQARPTEAVLMRTPVLSLGPHPRLLVNGYERKL